MVQLVSIICLLVLCGLTVSLRLPVSSKLKAVRNHRIPLLAATSSDGNGKFDDLELSRGIQEFNKFTVGAVKNFLVWCYGERHYARFAALETIARVPYFSYTSVLHLYETLGWFRQKEYIEVHFAESWNELHHLLIMEALGGNKAFLDRFIAQHIAFFYYWLVVALYMISPAVAYDLNKHVEQHAFETYNAFLEENATELKKLPPPQVALDYYEKQNPYLFDAFQSENLQKTRLRVSAAHKIREESAVNGQSTQSGLEAEEIDAVLLAKRSEHKRIESLYDVFDRIRADEAEHAKTMKMLQRDILRQQLDEDSSQS